MTEAIAQGDQTGTPLLLPLRPAEHTLHGAINGSSANTAADHPIANLFDKVSEQNPWGFELYGYLDQGVTLNPDSPDDRTNGPVLNNYRSNAYQMNALYLVAERKVNRDCDRLQLGGRIDLIYGTDAAFGLSKGLDENIVSDSASRFYKLALPQIYGNIYVPIGRGVSFKVGHFFSPVGNGFITPRTSSIRISSAGTFNRERIPVCSRKLS